MTEKFKTLFFVKSSLIFLYLSLTIPIPFISIDKLKIISLIAFFIGLYLIINITSDYVETCENKISYKTSFISKIFWKKNCPLVNIFFIFYIYKWPLYILLSASCIFSVTIISTFITSSIIS